jgi:hypothetical protein
MKRFSVLDPALDAAKIGRGSGHFNNGQILDVGFHDLGSVCGQGLDLLFEGVGNIHIDLRVEILSGRPFIEQHIADVPGGRHHGLPEMAVVLVGVIRKIAENEFRSDFGYHGFDLADEVLGDHEMCILAVAPKNLFGAQYLLRNPLFSHPSLCRRALPPAGHNQQKQAMPFPGVLDQSPATTELDIIRMGADCEDVHFLHGRPLKSNKKMNVEHRTSNIESIRRMSNS